MKMLWQGSDTLFLVKYPPSRRIKYVYMFCFRLFARFVDFFVQEHVCLHKLMKFHLIEFGMKKPITIHPRILKHENRVQKKPHREFNILYYLPKTTANPPFTKWVYGYDIFKTLKETIKNVNWIIVDGTMDMNEIYPIIDFYLRPTRHDGPARMRLECEVNNIPYYWSQQEPDVIEARKEIECQKKFKLG